MPQASPQIPLFDGSEEPDVESGFSIRESHRARRRSSKVYPRGRVEVVVPKRTSARAVREFVESHRDWIRDTRAAFAAQHPPEPFALPTSVRLPAIDRALCVRYERDDGSSAVRYRVIGNTVVLAGNTDNEGRCVAALKRWLIALGKKEYLPRLRALSVETANPFRKMHVRGQKTCWGSHSSTGTISLNYCLMFLEARLLRYVMIHELCHARHMNHSRRFWRAVAMHEPNYERLDRELGESWSKIPGWLCTY